MTLEREVKLPASPAFRMPPLHAIADGVIAVALEDVILHTVYYDAEDLRLLRAGASLRYREGHGWTAKLPSLGARSDALVREEIEFPEDGGVVPADAVQLLRAYLRTADVVPVLRLRTLWHRWELRDPTGRVLVEVDDDDVQVVSGTPARVRFRELEVERKGDDADELVRKTVEHLRTAGAGAPDPTPKPVRALGAIAAGPADVIIGDLTPDPTAGDVVRRALASSVLHLIRHDPVIRLDADPEGVHQARVATRRLRSDLRAFRPLLDEAWTRSLRDELSWLGDALGTARDADVLLGRIRGRTASLDDAERPAATQIVGALERRTKDAHAALMDVLASARYAELLDGLVGAANAPPLSERAPLPASDVLPSLVRSPWKRLRKAVRASGHEPTAEALHGIRIRAKRLRYASEAIAVVAGKPARRLAKRAEAVQDVLGEHHDAVVAASWLRTWASEASPDGAFAAGVLAGIETAAADGARTAWRDSWRALDRRKVRSWM